MSDHWTPESFEADDGSVPFARFIDRLPDSKFVALDAAIKRVLVARGIDLARTEWLKPLGGGLHEFRIRHDADEIERMFAHSAPTGRPTTDRILLRVFVHFHGQKRILLLSGYDKGRDPTDRRQHREMAAARRLLAQFKRRRRANRT